MQNIQAKFEPIMEDMLNVMQITTNADVFFFLYLIA